MLRRGRSSELQARRPRDPLSPSATGPAACDPGNGRSFHCRTESPTEACLESLKAVGFEASTVANTSLNSKSSLATRPKNSQDAEWQVDLIVAGVRRAKPAAAHMEEGTATNLSAKRRARCSRFVAAPCWLMLVRPRLQTPSIQTPRDHPTA